MKYFKKLAEYNSNTSEFGKLEYKKCLNKL